VVTGGGRGIGAAVATALAEAGCAVVVSARSRSDVEAVAHGLSRSGYAAHAVVCDVTDAKQVAALMEAASARVGAVDILVNNAGTASSDPVARVTLEEWNRVLAVNATGPFLCIREALPGMVSRGWGRVVNVASVAALRGERYIAAYAASKHAELGLTRAVAAEVEGTGVTVNAVCPGYVDTPMTRATVERVAEKTGLNREEAREAILRHGGQARLITPREVARAVVDLCLNSAADMNGRAVVIDGKEVGA
jgi:NAD(P)-dependent dehydrogenase (short-subunit alcohol dehydrogenase family)